MNHLGIITPTGDRFEGIQNLGTFLLHQTIEDTLVEWVVVDDGETNACARALAELGENALANRGVSIFYVRRKFVRADQGPKSLARNVLAGLEVISAPRLLIMEDDDCYREWYLEDMFSRLKAAHLVGTTWQKYYHLPSMSYKIYRNRGSAFCSTGMSEQAYPLLVEACRTGLQGSKGIDAKLWQLGQSGGLRLDIFSPTEDAVIGIKGLPGRRGIGVGHAAKGYTPDPQGVILDRWCGVEYASLYRKIREGMLT
jgi:hypothetical protein